MFHANEIVLILGILAAGAAIVTSIVLLPEPFTLPRLGKHGSPPLNPSGGLPPTQAVCTCLFLVSSWPSVS